MSNELTARTFFHPEENVRQWVWYWTQSSVNDCQSDSAPLPNRIFQFYSDDHSIHAQKRISNIKNNAQRLWWVLASLADHLDRLETDKVSERSFFLKSADFERFFKLQPPIWGGPDDRKFSKPIFLCSLANFKPRKVVVRFFGAKSDFSHSILCFPGTYGMVLDGFCYTFQ